MSQYVTAEEVEKALSLADTYNFVIDVLIGMFDRKETYYRSDIIDELCYDDPVDGIGMEDRFVRDLIDVLIERGDLRVIGNRTLADGEEDDELVLE